MSDTVPFYIAVAAGMIRCSTPVLLASVGECITEKAGVMNLGLEGIMLAGALSAVMVSCHTHSIALSLMIAVITGLALSFLLAVMCLKFEANQVASGIALTIFLSGITAYFGGDYVGKSITSISAVKIPLLSDLPVFGSVLFEQDVLVYFCFIVVPLAHWLIYHGRFGLALRSVGQDPRSAAAAGINVMRVRLTAMLIGGALAALAGAYLSLVYAQGWVENITAGRGWIAVGLVMFAGWSPWRALAGSYLFGLAVSLQLRMQAAGSDISPYLLGMLPYFLVISVMAVSSLLCRGKIQGQPAALGIPYSEQN